MNIKILLVASVLLYVCSAACISEQKQHSPVLNTPVPKASPAAAAAAPESSEDVIAESRTEAVCSSEKPLLRVDFTKIKGENFQVVYLKDDGSVYENYQAIDASGEGSNKKEVIFTVDEPIKNVKLLALTLNPSRDDGNTGFSDVEVKTFDEVNPNFPLVVNLNFNDAFPNNAVSYTGADGQEKVYSISIGADDGKLYLNELFPTEENGCRVLLINKK